MVSVTTISSISEFLMFLKAFPENNPCVANDLTVNAPSSFSTFDASERVPAVSIMSSMIMACLYATEPTKFMLPILPAPSRCLIIIAKVTFYIPNALSLFRKFLARPTPPASGDTTTMSFMGNFFCSAK